MVIQRQQGEGGQLGYTADKDNRLTVTNIVIQLTDNREKEASWATLLIRTTGLL